MTGFLEAHYDKSMPCLNAPLPRAVSNHVREECSP